MTSNTLTRATYERETLAIAQQLSAAIERPQSWLEGLGSKLHWDDTLLRWAISNASLRTQLFRLIDVLPSLPDSVEIARHLQEYLGGSTSELPDTLHALLNFAQPHSLGGQVAAKTILTATKTLAHRYIAGETLAQALRTIQRLRQQHLTFTLDMLGEAVISESEASDYLEGYLQLMEQVSQAAQQWSPVPQIDQAQGEDLQQVQVSVKITAFCAQFDPLDAHGSQTRVSDRLRTLLRRADELGVAVHFDMEQYVYKDLTLAILKKLLLEPEFRERTNIGLTLQAWLTDKTLNKRGDSL